MCIYIHLYLFIELVCNIVYFEWVQSSIIQRINQTQLSIPTNLQQPATTNEPNQLPLPFLQLRHAAASLIYAG